MTTNQDMNRNPTGKGGFGDNPQNRNDGRWSAETSIGWNYNRLIRFTVEEFKNWTKEHPESERTIAEELAYNAVISARKDLGYLKEVTDRTEGKSMQKNDITSGGNLVSGLVIIKDGNSSQ